MKSSEIVAAAWQECRPAKKYGEDYLCFALRKATENREKIEALSMFIQSHIPRLTNGYQPASYHYYWTETIKPELPDSIRYTFERLDSRYYEDKQKWVDSLIAELQAMGD